MQWSLQALLLLQEPPPGVPAVEERSCQPGAPGAASSAAPLTSRHWQMGPPPSFPKPGAKQIILSYDRHSDKQSRGWSAARLGTNSGFPPSTIFI